MDSCKRLRSGRFGSVVLLPQRFAHTALLQLIFRLEDAKPSHKSTSTGCGITVTTHLGRLKTGAVVANFWL
jgi:hypothetical protein